MNDTAQKKNGRLLVVFNVCQIKFQNYTVEDTPSQEAFWMKCIDSFLEQNHDNFDLVISGCRVKNNVKQLLQQRYGTRVSYNFTEQILTCFVTFNKTVELMVQHKGDYEGYVYVASGINCAGQRTILSEMDKRGKTGEYGIITVDVDRDGGRSMIFPPAMSAEWERNPSPPKGEDLVIPVGKLQNMHFQYFNHRLREAYGRVIPDVHRNGGVEWVFSYMASALHLKFVIMQDVMVKHATAFDGGSSGFSPDTTKPQHYDFLHGLTPEDVFYNDEARAVGFGYDDLFGAGNSYCLLHKPEMFIEEKFSIKGEELKNFIKTHFFLQEDKFSYDHVYCEFIPN